MGVSLSLDDISGAPVLAEADDFYDSLPEVEAPSITPARRAALEALEREFHDLLAART